MDEIAFFVRGTPSFGIAAAIFRSISLVVIAAFPIRSVLFALFALFGTAGMSAVRCPRQQRMIGTVTRIV